MEKTTTTWRLLGSFRLFVPAGFGTTEEQLTELLVGTPVHAALTMETPEFEILGETLPLRPRAWGEIRVRPGVQTVEGELVRGVVLDLPSDLARLMNAHVNVAAGMPYSLQTLKDGLARDTADALGTLARDWVKNTRFDGCQLHASTAPGCPRDTVAMGPETARMIFQALAETRPELEAKNTLDGLRFVTHREPVAGDENVRWVTLLVSDEVQEGHLICNPGDLSWLQGGDSDGDLIYLYLGGRLEWGETAPVTLYPVLEILDGRSPLGELLAREKKPVDRVSLVMAAKLKDLVGPMDYAFHSLAVAAGYGYAAHLTDVRQRVEAKQRITKGIFSTYMPMQEKALDGRKAPDAAQHLFRLGDTLQQVLTGAAIDLEAFAPYIGDEALMKKFRGGVHYAGGSTRLARHTQFGRLIAAGRMLKERAVQILTELGESTGDPIQALHRDALGIAFLPVKPKKRKKKQTPRPQPPRIESVGGAGPDSLLGGLTYLGQPLAVKTLPMRKNPDGTWTLEVFLLPRWKQGPQGLKTQRLTLLLPACETKTGHGHRRLAYGGPARLWSPSYTLVDGKAKKVAYVDWMRSVFQEVLQGYVDRPRGGHLARLEEDLNAALRQAVQKLPASTEMNDLVHLDEFGITLPSAKSITERWGFAETLLRQVSEFADVACTSKGSPGSTAAYAGDYGLPSWLLAVNPFARHAEPKREPQQRVLREALELGEATPLSVKSTRYPFPACLESRVRELTVIYADTNLNVFPDVRGEVRHDTVVVCPSGLRKLAVKDPHTQAGTWAAVEEARERFIRAGVPEDQIEVDEVEEDLGFGTISYRWTVTARGVFPDPGKVMSLVGPFKFVQTVIKEQLYVEIDGEPVEVDVILPRYTTVGKNALDAVAYTLCARAGVSEVDPETDLPQLLREIEAKLPYGGLCPVSDGEGVLGHALAGVLPFYCPNKTTMGCLAVRTGSNGIKVHWHEWVMAGLTPRTPKRVKQELQTLLALHGIYQTVAEEWVDDAGELDEEAFRSLAELGEYYGCPDQIEEIGE